MLNVHPEPEPHSNEIGPQLTQSPLPTLIAVASPKGGCGKTLAAVLLASEFAALGEDVLIIDSDPQGSAKDWFETSRANGMVLDRIACEHLLEQTVVIERIKSPQGESVVIVDIQGTAAATLSPAVAHADLIIVPTRASKKDVVQAIRMVKHISAPGDATRTIPCRILLNGISAVDKSGLGFKIAMELLVRSKLAIFKTALLQRPTFNTVTTLGSLYEVPVVTPAILSARENTRALVTEVIGVLNEGVEVAA